MVLNGRFLIQPVRRRVRDRSEQGGLARGGKPSFLIDRPLSTLSGLYSLTEIREGNAYDSEMLATRVLTE
jgi:hypothetical protein